MANKMNDLVNRVEKIVLEDSSKRIRKSSSNRSVLLELEDQMGLTSENTKPNLYVLIIANVHPAVFENAKIKTHFEELFRVKSNDVKFDYLSNLFRVRVEYKAVNIAASALKAYNKQNILGNIVQVFYAQMPFTFNKNDNQYLKVPEKERNFLISPPASPPVDWEPMPEARPNIDYDLISAVANLAPGQIHELICPGKDHPGIVIHVCENPDGYDDPTRPKIIQTRRPEDM